MNISRINISSQDKISSKQPALDSHESNLRKQITNLQEEMKSISNDKEMSEEQKTKEKQAAQEQLQNLNSELRRYQQQKRQEEAAKKQETVKEAVKEASGLDDDASEAMTASATDENASTDNKASQSVASKALNNTNEDDPNPALIGSKESGVLIALSSTKEQIADMGRIRTSLEGRQRTAPTEEEKASLQEKITKVSRGIGKKIIITEDAISSLRKSSNDEPGRKQEAANARKQREEELKIYANEQLDAINRSSAINNKKMFDNIAIVFS